MSRYEGRIEGTGEASVDAAEILAALGKAARATGEKRQEAVSCYLSASQGWQEALAVLGGAFAKDCSGLKPGKEE